MWFKSKKRSDDEQVKKIAASQKLLLDAAVSTADMAQFVTLRLKQCLDDAVKQFESTIAIMSDALLVCDSDGHIKACNPAATRIFEYSACDMMKQSILNLVRRYGSILSGPEELWSILRPDTVQETFGLQGLRISGDVFPIEVTFTRLDRVDGSVVMLMLIRDVSDLVALKRETETNARRYRSLFDLCFDGLLIVQHDRIVAANQQAGSLFGCKAESLLKVEFTRLVNHEDREKLERIDARSHEPVEANAVSGDGTYLSLLFSSVEIMWNDDKACLITVRDLNMNTIRQLERHRDNGVDMICCFDGNFRISFANETFCAYYSVPRDKSVGVDIRTLMPEAERNAFVLSIASLNPGQPTRRVQVHAGKTQMKLLDWIDHAVFDADGRIVEIQHTGRDITDLIMEISKN